MNAPEGHYTAVGLMSGTSMDGIDIALIESDGHSIRRLGPTGSRAYRPEERELIRRAVAHARGLERRDDRSGPLAEAEEAITAAHAAVVNSFLEENRINIEDIDVIGFHGQTVIHRPDLGFTVQLGDGAALAAATGIAVVHDLRAADMRGGGQGAPLAPVFHRALAEASGLDLPVVVVNVGGVANVTWLGEGDPVAFDTGPGNALIDDLVRQRTGEPYDRDGRLASAGSADARILGQLMRNPYFGAPIPKSLDRDAFDASPVAALSTEDAAATLTAFTAETIALSQRHFPAPPRRWIVSGGGARNPALLAALGSRVTADVTTADGLGWSGDHVEAQAFAYLAIRSLRGLPITFPTTTGVERATTGGVLARAPGPERKPRGALAGS